jgi:hypothetical protein
MRPQASISTRHKHESKKKFQLMKSWHVSSFKTSDKHKKALQLKSKYAITASTRQRQVTRICPWRTEGQIPIQGWQCYLLKKKRHRKENIYKHDLDQTTHLG